MQRSTCGTCSMCMFLLIETLSSDVMWFDAKAKLLSLSLGVNLLGKGCYLLYHTLY